MKQTGKAPVSERALVQRVNRKLVGEGQILKRARLFAETALGKYYVIDLQRNIIILHHVNLAALARKCGALAEWEELVEERA